MSSEEWVGSGDAMHWSAEPPAVRSIGEQLSAGLKLQAALNDWMSESEVTSGRREPLLHIDLTDHANDPAAARARVEQAVADWWQTDPLDTP